MLDIVSSKQFSAPFLKSVLDHNLWNNIYFFDVGCLYLDENTLSIILNEVLKQKFGHGLSCLVEIKFKTGKLDIYYQ